MLHSTLEVHTAYLTTISNAKMSGYGLAGDVVWTLDDIELLQDRVVCQNLCYIKPSTSPLFFSVIWTDSAKGLFLSIMSLLYVPSYLGRYL